MAGAGERIATTSAVERGSEKVIVTCLVDGLQTTGLISKTPKDATISVKFAERGFDMTAVVKAKGKETTFRKVVRKLPGSINKDQCTWKVEKGKVIISLVKVSDGSWAVQLSQRGLEQQSDDEEED
ncbi:uncharacterized protein [Littorina saxatilis]|uniref:CS domain-containing protein n=1 Tax=Littorina saxatilis TaxID=31220 RepID=A0AAN9G948_9CAEN